MSDYSQLLESREFLQFIPSSILSKYKYIAIDPSIQGGMPHIKGTRVIVFDVFIAQMEKISLNQLIMEYKNMGTTVTNNQLKEAFEFSLEALSKFIHGKKASK